MSIVVGGEGLGFANELQCPRSLNASFSLSHVVVLFTVTLRAELLHNSKDIPHQ